MRQTIEVDKKKVQRTYLQNTIAATTTKVITKCSYPLSLGEGWGEAFGFSGGFTELHTRSYEHILQGNGFRIGDTRKAIQTVFDIRNTTPRGLKGDFHPLAGLHLTNHPFEANNKVK